MSCPLDPYTFSGVLDRIDSCIQERSPSRQIHFLNVAKIVNANSSEHLRKVLWDGDFVLADGKPLQLLGRGLGLRIPDRIAGIDLMARLLELCTRKGYSVYFLGAKQDVLEQCVGNVTKKLPGLKVAGYRNGYFKYEQIDSIIAEVNAAHPDVLFIGMGTPQKEYFAFDNRAKLRVPIVQGVGGTFDVMAELVKRAPNWIQRIGLEWFYRVLQEPRRMFWRYFSTNTRFLFLYLKHLIRRK